MKRSITALSLVAVLAMYGSALAVPQDEYDDSQSYPLRVAAYLLHPVGVGLEYLIFRPFHWLVSYNDTTELIFGHGPHGSEEMRSLMACDEVHATSCEPLYAPPPPAQVSAQPPPPPPPAPVESTTTGKPWMK
jgi:hypothetical protein